jgi:ribosomal protein S18 acetylase RimI-like enzyme
MKIIPVTKDYAPEAKRLIEEGLCERFGINDDSFNPDLKNIFETYSPPERIFLIGLLNNEVVCTGALTKIDETTGRIERMSVKKAFRNCGLGKSMMNALEKYAVHHFERLLLETNNDWHSAIAFYESYGFTPYLDDGECTHFVKRLT